MKPRSPGQNLRETEEVLKAFGDEVIWRYMSMTKFISMLDSWCLYFARLDVMDDRHEGAISKPALDRLIQSHIQESQYVSGSNFPTDKARELAFLEAAATTNSRRSHVQVNCWHLGSTESGAMWATYGSDGIAITSTVRKLYECTALVDPNFKIQPIYYVDHKIQDMALDEAFLFKHQLFEYEHEIRAFFVVDEEDVAEPGRWVDVELDDLIDSVRLAPGSKSMHEIAVTSLLWEYGFPRIPVLASEADTHPAYRQGVAIYRDRLRTETENSLLSKINAFGSPP